MAIRIFGGAQFERCFDVKWDTGDARFREFKVQMVLDRSTGPDDGTLQPAKDAVVKTIPAAGMEREASLKNMPRGRNFLVSVVGKTIREEESHSPWIRMSTLQPLEPKECEELGHEDPFGKPRLQCAECQCPKYTPTPWEDNQAKSKDARCRCCGCSYKFHEILNVAQVLGRKAEQACLKMGRTEVEPLPDEALEWDDRECMLWFSTDGAFHPRKADVRAADRQLNGGGKRGRVSVICPTSESRQRFHRLIWKCFDAQAWPDKELVVVETYSGTASRFFKKMAKQDSRIIFASYERPHDGDGDWSIGTKRNVATHLATGEILANFDDDDLYAPSYLRTMVSYLSQEPKKKMVKLSSWYIFNTQKEEWGFCDPLTWGLTRGLDESDRQVKEWAYGYGFTYVVRRQACLETPYEDKNFGEDFGFVCALPERKGKMPVALQRDEFGICLHILHGDNTSDSIPLRTVKPDEAARLEVMELPHKYFAGLDAADGEGGSSGSRVPLAPRERSWRVVVHVRERDVPMLCKVRHTAADFLSMVQAPFNKKNPGLAKIPPWSSLSGWRIFRAPPAGAESEAVRDEIATYVLGVGHLRDEASPECWRSLLDRAKQPMTDLEPLGIRVAELWLRPPALSEAREVPADLVSGLNLQEDYITVHCECQRESGSNQFMLESFEVRVMSFWGTDVGALRASLGWFLSPDAQVIEELPGGEKVALCDEDPLPERLLVTEFRGRLPFYMKFSRDQALFFLSQTIEFMQKPGLDARLNKLMEDSTSFRAYNSLVGKILMSEVYPPLIKTMGLPVESTRSVDFFAQALEKVARTDKLVNGLEVKVTIGLRTWHAARPSLDNYNRLRFLDGEPPLVVDELPFLTWPYEQFLAFTDRKCNLARALAECPKQAPRLASEQPTLV